MASIIQTLASGVSTREMQNVKPDAPGVGKSNVSRYWKDAGDKFINEFRSRDIASQNWVVLMLDGIRLSKDQLAVVALGITAEGYKVVLDFELGSSESAEVCKDLMRRLSCQPKCVTILSARPLSVLTINGTSPTHMSTCLDRNWSKLHCTAIAVILLVAPGVRGQKVDDSKAVAATVSSNQVQMVGLKFDFEVESKYAAAQDVAADPWRILESSETIVTEHEFTTRPSPYEEDDKIIRRWLVYSKDDGQPNRTLRQFVIYDGKKTKLYYRAPQLSTGQWSRGRILPFELIDEFSLNVFEQFLFPNVRFGPTYGAGQMDKCFEDFGMKWEREGALHDIQVDVYIGRSQIGAEVELLVAKASPIVVGTYIRAPNGKIGLSYEVSAIATLNDISYPKRGTFKQFSGFGLDEVSYSFEVTNVSRATKDLLQNWVPDWPTGTEVQDAIDESNFSIPHDVRELDNIAIDSNARAAGTLSSRSKSWVFLICSILGIALLLWIYARAKRRSI